MIKCIVFARVSTSSQDLENQLIAVTNAAKGDGYADDEIITVKGKESAVSLDEEDRQTIQDMKDAIKEYPHIESIYFFAIDRLARRVRVVVDVVDDFIKEGINCVFLNPMRLNTININNGVKTENMMAHMIMLFLGYAAEMDAKMIKARLTNSKTILRKEGKLVEGSAKFGYKKLADRTLAIDRKDATIVREIFSKYSTGNYSTKTLGVEMTAKVGREFSREWIKQIIEFKGYSARNETALKYPAIVSAELQDKCIAVMHSKRSKQVHTYNVSKYTYLAKGIIRSKKTNHAMITQNHSSLYVTKEDKPSMRIAQKTVDSILRYIVKWWIPSLYEKKIKDDAQEQRDQITDNLYQIESLNVYIRQLKDKNNRIQRLLIKGSISEDNAVDAQKKNNLIISDYERKIAEIESDNQRLQLFIENQPKDSNDYLNILQENEVTNEQYYKYIRECVKTVWITDLGNRAKQIELEPTAECKGYSNLIWVAITKGCKVRLFVKPTNYKGKDLVEVTPILHGDFDNIASIAKKCRK